MVDKEIKLIEEKIRKIDLNELYKTFSEIPFGNSDFQDYYFVVNSQITPARAFRALCLRLRDRINALREAYYALKEEQIDLEEMEYKLSIEDNPFEKRRLEVRIEKIKSKQLDTKKLVDDALHEVNFLLGLYYKLPHPTREEFELEEREHFEKKLRIQALAPDGNLQSLLAMGLMINEKGELVEAREGFKFNVYEEKKALR